nr:MAG TPA: replication initiator protein [Caudoviricetes sp.]
MRVKIDSIEQSNFYKMPKKIYEYDLKPVDRELYMLCLENWRLSIANNWINEDGEIYFYATQEILAKKMNLDKKSVMRSFKKLVEIGILQVEKENGFSNKYFLTDLNIENQYQKGTSTSTKMSLPPVPKRDYTSTKMSLPPVPKRDTIKNKYNKNELIRINKKEYIYVIWNELAEELGLSKIKMLTDKRKRKIDVLLKKYTIEEIAEALEKIKESDFLQGKTSNWQMTFDDFIEEQKFIKLLEDGYKNKNSNKNSDIKIDKSGRKKIDLTEEDVMDTLKGWGLQ